MRASTLEHLDSPVLSTDVHVRKVAILLCTYQGERFLEEQLESFAAQDYDHWTVWVSDDGSSDATPAILKKYQSKWERGRLSILTGPSKGFVRNFLALTCNPLIQADYYAYADQDDIWDSNKLSRAMEWLDEVDKDVPTLYCSRTLLVDAENRPIGYSPHFSRAPSFANALVQNIGGGNTMVYNGVARRLLQQTNVDADVVSHDWWAYLIVTGCGGKVYYDPCSAIRYRQHGNNVIGSDNKWRHRFVRIHALLKGQFRKWMDQNIHSLQFMRFCLTQESVRILDEVMAARRQNLIRRIIGFKRSTVYRQTCLGTLGLWMAILLNRI